MGAVTVITLGCRLNAYESGVMHSHALAADLQVTCDGKACQYRCRHLSWTYFRKFWYHSDGYSSRTQQRPPKLM